MREKVDDCLRLWAYTIHELEGMNDFFSSANINDQFYRRVLLKNIFSIIETYIFICREIVRIKLEIDRGPYLLSWQEQSILAESKAGLNAKGEIMTSDSFEKFIPSLRFSMTVFSKIFGSDVPDFSNHQFGVIMSLSKRRNEVTHPKHYKNVIVSDDEIKELIPMFAWFMETHSKASAGFNIWLEKTYPGLS